MTRGRVKLGFAASALSALLLLTACGSAPANNTSSSTKKTVKIAVFLASAANTYNEAEMVGVKDAAKKLGGKVVKVFDGNFSTSTQVAQLQDAVESGSYNAFAIDANDGATIVPEVQKALKKGIKVAGMLAPIGPNPQATKNQIPGMTTTVSYSTYQNGAYIGQAVVSACAKINPCNVVYIAGEFTLPLETVRLNGFKATLASHANIHIISDDQQGDYLAANARNVMQNILQAHHNVNVVASAGDQMTYGAQQAVDSAGLTGKVALIGNGASAPGVTAVKNGTWYATVVNLPLTEGKIAGTALIKAVRGEKTGYPSWVNEMKYSPVGPIVNQQNVSQFTPQWKG